MLRYLTCFLVDPKVLRFLKVLCVPRWKIEVYYPLFIEWRHSLVLCWQGGVVDQRLRRSPLFQADVDSSHVVNCLKFCSQRKDGTLPLDPRVVDHTSSLLGQGWKTETRGHVVDIIRSLVSSKSKREGRIGWCSGNISKLEKLPTRKEYKTYGSGPDCGFSLGLESLWTVLKFLLVGSLGRDSVA